MAKWHGIIGWSHDVEDSDKPGVWNESITTSSHYGDILRKSYTVASSDGLNSNLSVAVTISILATGFIKENLSHMLFIEYQGLYWYVSSIDDADYPRVKITLGGRYNGPTS